MFWTPVLIMRFISRVPPVPGYIEPNGGICVVLITVMCNDLHSVVFIAHSQNTFNVGKKTLVWVYLNHICWDFSELTLRKKPLVHLEMSLLEGASLLGVKEVWKILSRIYLAKNAKPFTSRRNILNLKTLLI